MCLSLSSNLSVTSLGKADKRPEAALGVDFFITICVTPATATLAT
jgi:hypothetical protein